VTSRLPCRRQVETFQLEVGMYVDRIEGRAPETRLTTPAGGLPARQGSYTCRSTPFSRSLRLPAPFPRPLRLARGPPQKGTPLVGGGHFQIITINEGFFP
jgi:hypothetical protein